MIDFTFLLHDNEEPLPVPIDGASDYYITNHGRGLSTRPEERNLIVPSLDSDGYCRLPMTVKGHDIRPMIHTLVMRAFQGEPLDDRPYGIRHLDGNPSNNMIHNLEWVPLPL